MGDLAGAAHLHGCGGETDLRTGPVRLLTQRLAGSEDQEEELDQPRHPGVNVNNYHNQTVGRPETLQALEGPERIS